MEVQGGQTPENAVLGEKDGKLVEKIALGSSRRPEVMRLRIIIIWTDCPPRSEAWAAINWCGWLTPHILDRLNAWCNIGRLTMWGKTADRLGDHRHTARTEPESRGRHCRRRKRDKRSWGCKWNVSVMYCGSTSSYTVDARQAVPSPLPEVADAHGQAPRIRPQHSGVSPLSGLGICSQDFWSMLRKMD